MSVDLANCTAIVTGGSKGYGAGIAEELKKQGVEVWITGRDKEALKETARRIGVRPFRADVTRSKDWDRLFDEVMDKAGKLDILVNNAGAGIKIAPLTETSDDEISESIAVNLTGALLGCKRAAEVMKKQKSGTIINVSSVCATQAWPSFVAYSAAKAGLVQGTKCLYNELRESGVRVTSVIPSWGATSFAKAAGLPMRDAKTLAKCIQPLELGRLIVQICSLPAHLVIQEVILWPMIQEVVPL
ncbi:MAG: SDR family oxidoreductase [Planctomycetota bacterium]